MQQQILGDNVVRAHPSQHYKTLFNQRTGFFVRLEEDGYEEPLWAEDGPELIDLSITSYCERECKFCYRGANAHSYRHLSIAEVVSVVEQAAACGTMQMALGGGNPNQHPEFAEILKIIREHDIVPSYTTNGDGLSDEVLKETAEYCGAMAVSIYAPYDADYYGALLERIRSYGIKVNLHAIIRSDTLEMWTRWLNHWPAFLKDINAVIFLNYKPVGGGGEELMPRDYEKVESFFKAANDCKSVKIGFDSCSISGIVKWMKVSEVLLESCEAARFSCFISEDMKMYPCSFMVSRGCYGDLRKESLIDVWRNNEYFRKFRESGLRERCVGCKHTEVCKGGCRLFEEINFC